MTTVNVTEHAPAGTIEAAPVASVAKPTPKPTAPPSVHPISLTPTTAISQTTPAVTETWTKVDIQQIRINAAQGNISYTVNKTNAKGQVKTDTIVVSNTDAAVIMATAPTTTDTFQTLLNTALTAHVKKHYGITG